MYRYTSYNLPARYSTVINVILIAVPSTFVAAIQSSWTKVFGHLVERNFFHNETHPFCVRVVLNISKYVLKVCLVLFNLCRHLIYTYVHKIKLCHRENSPRRTVYGNRLQSSSVLYLVCLLNSYMYVSYALYAY